MLRISPQVEGTGRIVAIFDAVARGELSGQDAQAQIDAGQSVPTCQGYWHGAAGMDHANYATETIA
jgi:hypothetical protein